MIDGVDHINIYSKGKTKLGRYLSNFAYTPINTIDGNFNSIEDYWYWLNCTHINKDQLKFVYGWQAKQLGRSLDSVDWNNDFKFKLKIINAIINKLITHEQILELFKNNQLPFKHYYKYGNKIIEPLEGKWIMQLFEYLKSII